MTVSVLCPFHAVPWVDLWYMTVTFPGHSTILLALILFVFTSIEGSGEFVHIHNVRYFTSHTN